MSSGQEENTPDIAKLQDDDNIIKLTESQIKHCSFDYWYPNFKSVSFKSELIPLPDDFINWLHEDAIYMGDNLISRPSEGDRFDDGEDEWSAEEVDEVRPASFPELESRIQQVISNFDSEVFPKLNWSSPKDATWMMTSGNLKCTRAEDIFLLLKSSDFVSHDLSHAFESCFPPSSTQKPEQFYLVLRKWYDLKTSMEFRCFVKNQQIIGISQRDHGSFFPFLLPQISDIETKIVDFFKKNIQNQFPDQDYVLDVYISKKGKVYLVDFNPFGDITDPLLFEWDELHLWKSPKENEETAIDFRIVTSKAGIKPLAMTNRVPFDLMDSKTSLSEIIQNLSTNFTTNSD